MICKHKLCRRTLLLAAFAASIVLIGHLHLWACHLEPEIAPDDFIEQLFKNLPHLKPEGWK